jgi:prephenate dehydratase
MAHNRNCSLALQQTATFRLKVFVMDVAFLGPSGTHTEEALLSTPGTQQLVLVSEPTVYEAIMGVQNRHVERAFVPIENSLEGSVNATLDVLVFDAPAVTIIGEVVHKVHHHLIARRQMPPAQIEQVFSHPQATAQCAHFIHSQLPNAKIAAASSTSQAVATVAESDQPWAALGSSRAATLNNCAILQANVEDHPNNVTRFVWLTHSDTPMPDQTGPWKTSIVFWGEGADEAGWLVRCLTEFASRQINLTRIESRPRKDSLGSYMFFCDLEGHSEDQPVKAALASLRHSVAQVRELGSYPKWNSHH